MNRFLELGGMFALGLLIAFFGTAMLMAWHQDDRLQKAVAKGEITVNGQLYRLQKP